jgi:hypothetical protein
MIPNYYDKLLDVACPPAEIVRNAYLEEETRERILLQYEPPIAKDMVQEMNTTWA